MRYLSRFLVGSLLSFAFCNARAAESTVEIPGTANIYGAGHTAPPPASFGGSGMLPPVVTFSAGTGRVLTIVSATGGVTLDAVNNNGGNGPSAPDGGPYYAPTDVTATGGISGIKSTVTGFLVGVLLDDNEPTGTGPASLDFTGAGLGTDFPTLAPQLGQVFFIGDGRTAANAVQKFTVPATATRLFLGVVDAADGDNAAGPPQAYDDNGGAFSATVAVSDSAVTKLVFSSNRGLKMTDADGSNSVVLIPNGSFFASEPVLDATGRLVAFKGYDSTTNQSGLLVMKAEPMSANNTPQLVAAGSADGRPSWSPNGRQLAFTKSVGQFPQLFVVNAVDAQGAITPESAQNAAVQVTSSATGNYYEGAVFSPDDRYLATSANGSRLALLRIRGDAGALTPESSANPVVQVSGIVSGNLAKMPAWNPESTRLVFAQTQSDSNFANPKSALSILTVRGADGAITPESSSNLRTLITQIANGNFTIENPTWSADGARIAFAAADASGNNFNIFTIAASSAEDATSNPRVALTTAGSERAPSFAQASMGGPTGEPEEPVPPFSITLSGVQPGQLIAPGTTLTFRVNLAPGTTGTTLKRVQFFIDQNNLGAELTRAPFKKSTKVDADDAGTRTVTAVAVDALGRVVSSAPITYQVAPAAAGNLALTTDLTFLGGNPTPGALVFYRLYVTNTSRSATAQDVKIVAPVPRELKLFNADSYNATGGKTRPKPEIAPDREEVLFSLGDIRPGQRHYAELTLRVPYDARIDGRQIIFTNFDVRGKGMGGVVLKGSFFDQQIVAAGTPPSDTPRLALLKTIVDRPNDSTDVFDIVDDAKFGPIPGVTPGDKLTILLLAANFGVLPAERVLIKDRIPFGCEYVPGSARRNDQSIGSLLKLRDKDRTLELQFGNVAGGETLVISYQIRIKPKAKGGPSLFTVVESQGAQISSSSLRVAPKSFPEKLPIKIVAPVALTGQTFAVPAVSVVGQPTTYILEYRNEGGRTAQDVRLKVALPPGTTFKSATVPPGQRGFDVANSEFLLGNVPPESTNQVQLEVNVTSDFEAQAKPSVQLVTQLGESSAFSAAFAARASTADAPAPSAADLIVSTAEYNRLGFPNRPRLALLKSAPQSVQQGGTFTYTFTVMNTSRVNVQIAFVSFDFPAGTAFVSASAGGPQQADARKFLAVVNNLAPNSAQAVSVTLRATGNAGTPIIERTATAQADLVPNVTAPDLGTLIIAGEPFAPDNQIAIANTQLAVLGLDASASLSDPAVRDRIATIDGNAFSYKVGAADYLDLTNGSLLIQLGNGKVLGAGDSSLIDGDPSTLIGQDGGSIVAAGGGNLINFTGLIGQDGNSLVGQDGNSILADLAESANIVTARGGSIVNAAGGNFVGQDGASLIGQDGNSFSFSHMVAARGGNIFAAKAGSLIGQDGNSLVSSSTGNFTGNQAELVSIAGGNIVAAGGGGILAGAGLNRISTDASRAISIGANGSFTTGGGGAPIVAAGGGN